MTKRETEGGRHLETKCLDDDDDDDDDDVVGGGGGGSLVSVCSQPTSKCSVSYWGFSGSGGHIG